MVFWVTRATEDFVCNTFRAMTMANFHLTKKPTLPGIWTAGGSCSSTMIDDNDENDDDEIAFPLPDGKTGNPYVGEGHENKTQIYYTWTKLLQLCHNLFLVPFFFPPFCLSKNVLIHNMYSYPDCRRQAKGNETGKRIPFRSSIKDHTCINSLFSLQGAIIAIVTSS